MAALFSQGCRLVAFLGDLKAAGCDVYLHVQAVDTTAPAGKALFQKLGVFSGFERSIIQERIMRESPKPAPQAQSRASHTAGLAST
jgi:DNA invertase Pin-like site-specific DNA recombinase